MPWRLILPLVGSSPTTPQIAAGSRTEPPVSEPKEPNTAAAATAAAEPELDPPAMKSGFHGLRARPTSTLRP